MLDGVSNRRYIDCWPNILFRCRSKKTSKLRVAGLCEGNSPVTGEFPAQMASNAETVSIWWRHHDGNVKGCLNWPQRSQGCPRMPIVHIVNIMHADNPVPQRARRPVVLLLTKFLFSISVYSGHNLKFYHEYFKQCIRAAKQIFYMYEFKKYKNNISTLFHR